MLGLEAPQLPAQFVLINRTCPECRKNNMTKLVKQKSLSVWSRRGRTSLIRVTQGTRTQSLWIMRGSVSQKKWELTTVGFKYESLRMLDDMR